MVHAEIHAPMEPSELEVQIESQIPDEALNQVGHPPAPKDPVQEEKEVPKPLLLPIVPPQPKLMVLEETLPQVLLCPDQCLCLIHCLKYLINWSLFKFKLFQGSLT